MDRLVFSEKLRSLLGSAQDYIQLASGLPDSSLSTLEWELRKLEDQLTYYEEQLSDGRMAIFNGIRLYQDVSASAYDRARAYDRMMEAKEEIRQAIRPSAPTTPTIPRWSASAMACWPRPSTTACCKCRGQHHRLNERSQTFGNLGKRGRRD